MARAILVALLALAAVGASQSGVAASGDLLWSDQFDRARLDDRFQAVAVEGGRVYAVGRTDGTDPDGLVRCYDATSGEPCWEDFFDLAGGEDEANAVAAKGHRVFVAGTGQSASGDLDFLVRAYDARSGLLLWQDVFDPRGRRDRARAVAVRGGTVFVAGTFEEGDFKPEMLVVRAYDARTGALEWQNLFEPPLDFVSFGALGVKGRWVVLVGGAETHTTEDDFLVHVIDRKSGATVRDDLVDGAFHDNDFAAGLAMGGGRAFAVGWLNDLLPNEYGGSFDFVVRAYDLAKGTLLWQDAFGEPESPMRKAFAAALSGGRLVVAGLGGPPTETDRGDFLVRCYDARSGTLLWDDTVDVAGDLDEASAVASAGGTVVVGGHATDELGAQQTLVRAYDGASGALLFEDRFDGVSIGGYAVDVAVARGRGFVASAVTDLSQAEPGAIADAVIRAYDLR